MVADLFSAKPIAALWDWIGASGNRAAGASPPGGPTKAKRGTEAPRPVLIFQFYTSYPQARRNRPATKSERDAAKGFLNLNVEPRATASASWHVSPTAGGNSLRSPAPHDRAGSPAQVRSRFLRFLDLDIGVTVGKDLKRRLTQCR